MERYVDGFLIPLARDKVERYRAMAAAAAVVWKEHGALEYYECLGEDLDIPGVASFRAAAAATAEETVVFSWIVYTSREHRDAVNAAVMADPRIKAMMEVGDQPFDPARMAYGGFRTLVIG